MAGCLGLGAKLRELEQGGQEVEVHVPFTEEDWVGLSLSIPASQHGLPLGQYDVTVNKTTALSWDREVKVEVRQNRSTGEVRLFRSPRSPAFSGYVVIDWARQV